VKEPSKPIDHREWFAMHNAPHDGTPIVLFLPCSKFEVGEDGRPRNVEHRETIGFWGGKCWLGEHGHPVFPSQWMPRELNMPSAGQDVVLPTEDQDNAVGKRKGLRSEAQQKAQGLGRNKGGSRRKRDDK
jgi:hypothetical protein